MYLCTANEDNYNTLGNLKLKKDKKKLIVSTDYGRSEGRIFREVCRFYKRTC